ncbi:MAG TPA: nuclease-related domain-containing protein [Bacillales bacterium]|nr:nuclease-related domain-containing protein [Bacillales bacterium]
MILKSRTESEELKLLRFLDSRMKLSARDANDYWNHEKGYEGEEKFDTWLEDSSKDWLILNDLLLESNNTLFQIDSLVICQKKIYLFEVKNYEGDFYMDGDRWYTLPSAEIKSPFLQLKRSESLFRRLLHDLGWNIPVESHLIFMNPHFYLYQAPLDLPAVFPNQLNRFMDKLKKEPSKLSQKHSAFAEKLLSLHLNESPYTRLPDFDYNQLKKGIVCPFCWSTFMELHGGFLICKECGRKEKVDIGVLRSVKEFHALFPDRAITTNIIQEWCKIISTKAIRRILLQNFKLVGHSKSAHYVEFQKQK